MTVQTFGTNNNNDLYLGSDGNIAIVTGLEAVLEACATASKAQLGEMIFAQNSGIPNFQAVWIGTPQYAIFQAYLRTALENVEGVVKVEGITLSVSDNILSYTATIETIYGTEVLNERQFL